MADLSNGGRFTRDVWASARNRPWASVTGRVSVSTTRPANVRSTVAKASSNDTIAIVHLLSVRPRTHLKQPN